MRASTLLLPVIALLLSPAQGQPGAAPSPARFQSIELRGGGVVTVRHGATHRVRVGGESSGRPIRSEGETLVIDRCARPCPRGHRIEVEIVTPEIARLAVRDGGLIQLVGAFPSQAAAAAAVSSGGTIDMRPLEAASVSAAVNDGGRIFARPRRELAATVSDGGNITYWGEAAVTSSVRRGGVVAQGAAADLRAPLARLDPPLPALKALRPVAGTHRPRHGKE
jgi:Putative auto-transporter adhesin, head GIN domain